MDILEIGQFGATQDSTGNWPIFQGRFREEWNVGRRHKKRMAAILE